jgi:cyclopropane fatty-acyl-phospholipid synthase-like methyltransferase
VNSNWFETFFEGLALDMWRNAVTPEQTKLEADFLEKHLQLCAGMCALDVPCGNGRHATELAKRGVRMTGVDLSRGFIDEAREKSAEVEWVHEDMRTLPWSERFDAAYCWGNSFGYFEPSECERFLRSIAATLKPGARFFLESGAVAESLLPVLQPERTMRVGDIDFHSRNTYAAAESRMDITYTFSRGEQREEKSIHQWLYSAGEIRRMLIRAGLEPVDAFGDLEAAPYALRSPRLLVLTKRKRSQG